MGWQGVINITATLETEYEFRNDGLLSAATEQEAKTEALRMLHEDILQLSYGDPNDLRAWLKESVQYVAKPS